MANYIIDCPNPICVSHGIELCNCNGPFLDSGWETAEKVFENLLDFSKPTVVGAAARNSWFTMPVKKGEK